GRQMSSESGNSGLLSALRRAFALVVAVAMILGLVLGQTVAAFASSSPTGATISSDQADYAPGSLVTLTGDGWAVGEAVHIFVNDDVGKTWSNSGDVTANSDGAFTDAFNLPTSFVAVYSVTATGATSGTATTSFTDNDAYDWSQCKNDNGGGSPVSGGTTNDGAQDPCKWVNGDLGSTNSIYAEGDVVRQRAIRTLESAGSHSITLDHSFV